MQDIHSGRLFGGGGGGDRRLRPNQHHNLPSLKCPRCDSLNTKFCYYNNYNLSQPRHFCKNCRRYWTKGGVLRNVPVGGGCRKSKRSKQKSTASRASAITSSAVTPSDKSNSNSSSSSSSQVASTSTAANLGSEVVNYQDSSSFFMAQKTSARFEEHLIDHSTNARFDEHEQLIDHSASDPIFQDIGSFSNMINSSNNEAPSLLGFTNMAEIPTSFQPAIGGDQSSDSQWPEPEKTINDQNLTSAGFLDQSTTHQIDFSSLNQNRGNNSAAALPPLDWSSAAAHGGGDSELFDLPGAVDQAYWNQTQWNLGMN